MTKLEIDALLSLQLEAVHELIETMPNPDLWRKGLHVCVSQYKKRMTINTDDGVNYTHSGIREFVLSLVNFARKIGLSESAFVRPREPTIAAVFNMSIDELLEIDETDAQGNINIYPNNLLQSIEIYQNRIDALPKITLLPIDICSCGAKMKTNVESGAIECSACGQSFESILILFKEDRSFINFDSQKTKSNTYKTSKHFEKWYNRILAIEVKPGSHLVVPKIKEYFNNLNVPKDLIDYASVRQCLKKCNLKAYYETVSWFLKEVSGRSPPTVTDEEHMDIAYRFDVIIDTFDRIRNSDVEPSGRTYYPFFIYKIIETKFAKKRDKLRLLKYIHVQNEKTLKKNEALYQKILREANNPRLSAVDD